MSQGFFLRSAEDQISSLTEFAHDLLAECGLKNYSIECINYEFNATFAVLAEDSKKYALRININSTRTLSNTHAEIAWLNFLQNRPGIQVGQPQKFKGLMTTADDSSEYVTQKLHRDSGRTLTAVLITWIDGEELDDEPTDQQIFAMGKAMANLHEVSSDFRLPAGCKLPKFDDPFWGTEDCLFSSSSALPPAEALILQQAFNKINDTVAAMYQVAEANGEGVQIIHADMHGGNVLWSENQNQSETKLAVIDFDDSGIGLLVQDISIALYYFDTPEQDALFLKGYESIRALPKYSECEMDSLLLHRRLMLLNYLYETTNQEHRAMIPDYLAETMRRAEKYLALSK